MRKLMWITIGFAAACGLFAYVFPADAVKIFCIAAGLFVLLFAVQGRKNRLYVRMAFVCLGVLLGSLWYGIFDTYYLAAPASMEGKTEYVTIRTTDISTETDFGISVPGIVELDGKQYRVKAWLDRTEPLESGFRITAPFRFTMTAPKEDPASYHSGNGIFLLAYQQEEARIVKDEEVLWQDRVSAMRQWLKNVIHTCFPSDVEPFARALLMGDTSLIDYETDTDFKVSGIRHVIAVSGLHVSILIALLSTVTFRRKYFTVPVGLGVLLIFAALAGFSPSVTRSCLMSALLLLAMLFNREYDGATALSFAVLVMLIGNPLVVASVSFQLSVASVSGIYLFNSKIRAWLQACFSDPKGEKRKQRGISRFCASVSITLSAMILTAPLCAYYFGMVSLVGVMTNLLALWIISGIFYGIMAVCMVYTFWIPGAVFLGKLFTWPIRYVLGVARIMAKIPLAAVYMDTVYMIVWFVFIYILLVVFLCSRVRKPVQLLCCGVISLCIALLVSWSDSADTRITILDVGQGQCILLQNEGRTYMVDCGGDSNSQTADIAANHLLSRGINRLDGLILTHLDRDHAGAAQNLMSRIDTDLLILPNAHSALSAKETVFASQDLCLQAGDTKILVYAPTFPGTSNEKSLCVLFDTEKCDILITGDRDAFGERMLLRTADIPDVDILVAGHHGSKNSTCGELLNAARPEVVCISTGKDNPYGHPAAELLNRLASYGCNVYRTDLHGTITIRR